MLSELYIVKRFVSFSGFCMNTMDSKYCNEKELLSVFPIRGRERQKEGYMQYKETYNTICASKFEDCI